MKTTKKQYELFKKECAYWIKRFSLESFEIRFYWDEINGRANCNCSQLDSGVIKIGFGKTWTIEEDIRNINEYIKRCAKHEILHAMLGEYSYAAEKRFVTPEEMYRLEEKLINKLYKLIN